MLYALCDAVVNFPVDDGFPVSFLEAAAAGRPIITDRPAPLRCRRDHGAFDILSGRHACGTGGHDSWCAAAGGRKPRAAAAAARAWACEQADARSCVDTTLRVYPGSSGEAWRRELRKSGSCRTAGLTQRHYHAAAMKSVIAPMTRSCVSFDICGQIGRLQHFCGGTFGFGRRPQVAALVLGRRCSGHG